MPTIQEEVEDLDLVKVLNKRTRGGTSTASSASIPRQPSILKKKRKHSVRKMKFSTYVMEEDDQIEATTELVSREVRRKKATNVVSLQKALEIAKDIEVPTEALLKESSVEAAHKVIELTENLQQLVVASNILEIAEEGQREEATCSEVVASEATRGNLYSHNISKVIEIESSSTSSSHSTFVSTSSDIDNIPLNRVYANLHKSVSPSPSTKHQKKPDDDTFVPMYPYVLDRIGEMVQMRVDICSKLPANHPFQPPFIQPLQTIPADAEVEREQAVNESDIPAPSSSSQPQPSTQTSDPSVLDKLANHYQDELPGFEANSERASEIASEEVVLESPHQQEPNLQMASNTCSELIIHPEFQPYHLHATHSNISFGIALRNLANKKTSTNKSPASENLSSFLEESTLVVQPLSVALPSEATLDSQPSRENSTGPDFIITSTSSDDEDEQTNLWFKPEFFNQHLSSSSTFVLESVHDQPFEPSNQIVVTENTSIELPSSSNQTCPHI